MKIGYIKQGCPISLSWLGFGTSVGGMVARHVLLKGLPEKGHQVAIFSPVLSGELHCLKDYKVEYDPIPDRIPRDIDVLYIENGPDNYTYRPHRNSPPFIVKMHSLLKHYKGLVIYDYTDPLMRPALIPEAYGPSTYQYLNVATCRDLFKNKGWVFTFKGDRHQLMAMACDNLRAPVYTLGFATDTLNLACFLEEFWKKPAKVPLYDTIYAGNQRPRKRDILKWYGNLPSDINKWLMGTWEEEDVANFKATGIKCMGRVPMANYWQVLNQTLCQLYLTDNKFLASRAIADRAYDNIQSGCILFFPNELLSVIPKSWKCFSEERTFIVGEPIDFKAAIREVRSLTWEERCALNELQVSAICGDTISKRTGEFLALVEKWKDLPKTQPDKIIGQLSDFISMGVLDKNPNDSLRSKASKEKRMSLLKGRYNFTTLQLETPILETDI